MLLTLAVSGAALAAGDQTDARFEVLARAPAPGGYSGDVVLHRGHAYLSSHRGAGACPAQGVRVFSLADPRRPRRLAAFGRIARTWTEKTIVRHVETRSFRGELAVTSVQACAPGSFQGFALYDVTRPARPLELARFRTDPRGSHELWLQPVGSRVYVYTAIVASEFRSSPDGTTPGEPDFRIVDVSDPRKPVEVGGWGAWKELGVAPFADPSNRLQGNFVHSVGGDGKRAYLSYWDLGTVVLDVSKPSRPRYVGRTRGDVDNSHSAWLGRDGLLVETHETRGGTATLYRRGAGDPVRLSTFALPDAVVREGHRVGGIAPVAGLDLSDSVHDAKLVGGLALFSWYGQGVVAVDVSDPRRPRFLARFLSRPEPDPGRLLCPGRRCTAVWGVDIEGETIVASDLIGGLWVLRLRRT
ncbi:MAG: hypothetical protein MSC30_03325 [Gaiellaceae bacterium MAG52_C11]|nr:hypothetical protein [Candidatus Gaiellasilicea maunaloa]